MVLGALLSGHDYSILQMTALSMLTLCCVSSGTRLDGDRQWPEASRKLPTPRYHLRHVVSVKRKGIFSLEFARGRRFGVLPVASGRKHFVATLDAQLRALGK